MLLICKVNILSLIINISIVVSIINIYVYILDYIVGTTVLGRYYNNTSRMEQVYCKSFYYVNNTQNFYKIEKIACIYIQIYYYIININYIRFILDFSR